MTSFYRLSGGGNDFLALVEPRAVPAGEVLAAWCRRGVSLGADGVFVLDRPDGLVRMRYFNSDGRSADLCLNGTRCAVRLARELGWWSDSARSKILTGAGVLEARVAGEDLVEVEVPVPAQAPQLRQLLALESEHVGWEVLVGVPHFVELVRAGLAEMELGELGPALRHHPAFPEGANVNWIEPTPDGFTIRTWERGVEAETLACGTGVLAATAAGIAANALTLPLQAHTRGGFTFEVSGHLDRQEIRSWSLTGDARLIARGEILPGALAAPAS